MLKSLVLFGLASSLIAFTQTQTNTSTNNSGYVTSAPSIPLQDPPLLMTPSAALPGSGTADGAPPALGVNDPRNGGAGSVYQPAAGTIAGGAVDLKGTTTNISYGSANPGFANGSASSTPAISTGLGTVIDTLSGNQMSLADIARRYKTNAHAQLRKFDNSNVRAAIPAGDSSNPAYESQSATGPTPDASSQVLDQHDMAAVQAALARGQNDPAVNAAVTMPEPTQQPGNAENMVAQATTPEEATTPQVGDTVPSDEAASNSRLPASSSQLPMLALMGLIACSAGGLCVYKFRRSEVRG